MKIMAGLALCFVQAANRRRYSEGIKLFVWY